MENRWITQLKVRYQYLVNRSNAPDYRYPENFQERKHPFNVVPHCNVQQPRAATSNWKERGESAKTSDGTQQHN